MNSLYELVLSVCLAASPFTCEDVVGPGRNVPDMGPIAYSSRRQCQNSGQAEAAAWAADQSERLGKSWRIVRYECAGFNTLAKI